MKIFATLGLILALTTAFTSKLVPHQFYVSITELNVVNDTVQISMRLFSDDLENALKENNGMPYYLGKASDYDRNQNSILRYLEGKFTVGPAAKPASIHWLGHEYEEDVTWLFGEAVIPKESRMLFVKNSVLQDLHDKQQNMIHLKTDDGFETQVCNEQTTEVRFVLSQN